MVAVNLCQFYKICFALLETLLWIDALCIDQSNLSERTHQVSMMHDVVEKVISTTVWLSPGTKGGFLLSPLDGRVAPWASENWNKHDINNA